MPLRRPLSAARRIHPAPLAFLACLLFLAGACSKDQRAASVPGKKEAAGIPVTAAAAIRKTIPLQLSAVGNVEAFSTVGVLSQVAGEIREVHFTEGQEVKQGDRLFSIDARPYENAVREAEANLAVAQARLANSRETLAAAERTLATDRKRGQAALESAKARADDAQAKARRVGELLAGKLASQEENETAQTAAVSAAADLRQAQIKLEELEGQEKSLEQQRQGIRAAEAQVMADQASLEDARLQLGYCSIYAPISGRTGSLMIHKGNLVKANNGATLVVINQIQPINLAFSLPELYLAQVRRLMEGGRRPEVRAVIDGEEDRPEEGVLSFVDNAVDAASGTIRLKGLFANAGKRLWPGQFVSVVLTLSRREGAVVVPAAAVMTGQEGQYVFVVKPDQTVTPVLVTVGRTIGSEAVVDKGLAGEELVVTDGQMKLSQGAKVEIRK